jgi:glutamate N-acetyltransferase / amino-acid N-acetyltransferase
MLGFVTCDAAVSPHLWQQMLSRAADRSFNSITVDGDTSTNDSLIALANGQSRTPAITEMGAEAEKLESMLTAVCQHLAKAIARDGEGATCLIEVQVTGAADEAAARQVAKTIVSSSLFKLRIQLGNFLLMDHGQPLPFDKGAASAYLKQIAEPYTAVAAGNGKPQSVNNPVVVKVSLGNGKGTGKAWGCDLSYDYVKINAEYTT